MAGWRHPRRSLIGPNRHRHPSRVTSSGDGMTRRPGRSVGGRGGRTPHRGALPSSPVTVARVWCVFFFLCVFFLTCDCGRGLPAKLSHRGTSWAGPAPPVPPHPLLYTTSEALTWSPDRQTGGAAAGRGFGGACKREGPLNGEEYSSQCVGGGTRRAAGGGLGARPAGLLGWGGAPKNLVRAPRQRGTEVVGQHASPSPPSQRPQRLPPRVQPHWCRSRAGRARLRRRLCCFPARRGGGGPSRGGVDGTFSVPALCAVWCAPLRLYVGACRPSARHPPRGPPMAAGSVASPTRQPAWAPTGVQAVHGRAGASRRPAPTLFRLFPGVDWRVWVPVTVCTAGGGRDL